MAHSAPRVAWVIRWINLRLAFNQAWRGVRNSPLAKTSWEIALRRGLVVAAFVALGQFVTGLDHASTGAFGALQVALWVAAVPRRRLLAYLGASVLSLPLVAFFAALTAGTWWVVLLVAIFGSVTGSLSRTKGAAFMVALNATVLAILFGARPSTLAQARDVALWIALGAIAQAIAMLLLWRRDRRLTINQLLANGVASLRHLVTSGGNLGGLLAGSYRVEQEVNSAVLSAGLLPAVQERVLNSAAWLTIVRRAIVRWREIHDPSLRDRQEVGLLLVAIRMHLAGVGKALPNELPSCLDPAWQCDADLAAALRGLLHSLAAETNASDSRAHAAKEVHRAPTQVIREAVSDWKAGIRMSAAIIVAEMVAASTSDVHAFWIPLTVVFIVQTDWSFTLIRTLMRVSGTIIAVIVMGAFAAYFTSSPIAIAVVCLLFAVFTVKWMSGNYALATFAVTGFILTVNMALYPSPDIVWTRLQFTVIGAVIGLGAALIFPAWRRFNAHTSLDVLVSRIVTALRALDGLKADPSATMRQEVVEAGLQCRNALSDFAPIVTGTVLEPRLRAMPVPTLLDALHRAQRLLVTLLAIDAYAFACAERGQDPRFDGSTSEALTRAGEHLAEISASTPETPGPLAARLHSLSAQAYPHEVGAISPQELVRVHLVESRLLDSVVTFSDSVRDLEKVLN